MTPRQQPFITRTRALTRAFFASLACLWLTASLGCDTEATSAPAGTTAESADPRTVDTSTDADKAEHRLTDDMGRSVTLPATPHRIAAAAPFAVEMLYDLDHPPVIRPDIEAEHVRPARARDLPALAISHSVGPNLEQLAAARPDLVILTPTFAGFAESIQQTLDTPAIIYRINHIDDVPRIYRDLGRLLDKQTLAEQRATQIEKQFESMKDRHDDGPKVFAIFGVGDAYFAFLPDSYLGSMIDLLGGTLVTEGLEPMRPGATMATFSLETILERDPDLVLIARHGEGDPAAALARQPAWSGLRAVREGRVEQISEWLYVSSPGPTAVDALNLLEPIMHPAAVESPSR